MKSNEKRIEVQTALGAGGGSCHGNPTAMNCDETLISCGSDNNNLCPPSCNQKQLLNVSSALLSSRKAVARYPVACVHVCSKGHRQVCWVGVHTTVHVYTCWQQTLGDRCMSLEDVSQWMYTSTFVWCIFIFKYNTPSWVRSCAQVYHPSLCIPCPCWSTCLWTGDRHIHHSHIPVTIRVRTTVSEGWGVFWKVMLQGCCCKLSCDLK